MLRTRQFSVLGLVILVGMMALSGCATRKYVRNEVDALEPRITEASTAARENAERIDAVDRRAQQGITSADQKATQAQQAAQTAQTAAQAADRKAETANQAVQQATNRISTIESRIAGMGDVYEPAQTISVSFSVNSSTLSNEAKSTLDRIAGDASGMTSGYMIEIQGFTDSTGSEMYNINLSQRRAESVMRYLVTKNVPLYRVSIVGLGEANPVANNNTRQGRQQNRRVEVRLLRSTGAKTTND